MHQRLIQWIGDKWKWSQLTLLLVFLMLKQMSGTLKVGNVSLEKCMNETSLRCSKMVNSQYKQSALRVLIDGLFSR